MDDPSMGETAVILSLPSENTPPAAPPTNYPVGTVDFNKPFEVFDANAPEERHTDAKVLTILAGNTYPVVILSHDGSEEVVTQFDTDGESMGGDLKVENVTEQVEQTKYVVIYKWGLEFSTGEALFDTQADAIEDCRHNNNFFAAVPVTIPAHKQEITGEDSEEEASAVQADGSVYVNDISVKAGDKVRSYRINRGSRTCTVIKVRNDSRKSLFIKADNGWEDPYWALNKNISVYHDDPSF